MSTSPIERLKEVMQCLRDPKTGCPWDREQTFSTVSPYTIEEAYEVDDAIKRKDYDGLREELGDLLLQVIFHSQMASEQDLFDFDTVVQGITEKMIRRHPHVFDDAAERDSETQSRSWELQKEEERYKKAANKEISVLEDVALALPALMRAEKMSKRVARVGFDWPDEESAIGKIEEEIQEIREAISQEDRHALEEELGDLLFAVCSLSRRFKIDPEVALRRANDKFELRFRHVEQQLKQKNRVPQEASLDELFQLWNSAKQNDPTNTP